MRRVRQAGRRLPEGAEEGRVVGEETEEGEGEERGGGGGGEGVGAAGSGGDVRGGGEKGAEEESRRGVQEVVSQGARRFHRQERDRDGQQHF